MSQSSESFVPVQERRANGVGLAALIVGAVALVLAVIPVLSFLAWPPAVAAIVLGIVGLIVKGRRRLFAWLGIVLGVLALLIGIVVSIVSLAGLTHVVDDALATSTSAATSSASASASSTPGAAAPATTAATAAPAAPGGAAENAAALAAAEQDNSSAHPSKAALYAQLVSSTGGAFSAAAAQYAVDNVSADFTLNAIQQAQQLLNATGASAEDIRGQLISSGKFTEQEADLAVAALGS